MDRPRLFQPHEEKRIAGQVKSCRSPADKFPRALRPLSHVRAYSIVLGRAGVNILRFLKQHQIP